MSQYSVRYLSRLLVVAWIIAGCKAQEPSSPMQASMISPGLPQTGLSRFSSYEFAASKEDLLPVDGMIGNASVVALGESIHTNGTYHKVNARLARYLIEEKGFRELAIETPWKWARVLGEYTRHCEPGDSPVQGLKRIFPQFASVELQSLYEWIRIYNCAHPKDQVDVYGFDIQQVAFNQLENWHDEPVLESFVKEHVPALLPRLNDLRICGPRLPADYNTSIKDDEALSTCHQFLQELSTNVIDTNPDAHDLRSSLIALRYAAAMARFNNPDSVFANGWRDEGMARMIQHLKSPTKRTIVLAHNGHIFHAGEVAMPFATKSMGSWLDDMFGDRYRVIVNLGYRVSKVSWWDGEDLYQPSAESLEGGLNALNLGPLLLNVRDNSLFAEGSRLEFNGGAEATIQRHMDGVIFSPLTEAMTNVPGITYPSWKN